MKSLNKILMVLLFSNFFFGNNSCQSQDKKIKDPSKLFAERRKEMVEQQIAERGIINKKILNAFLKVERHKFVPDSYKNHAYDDNALPIGEGQTISQPYIVAFMTDVLELESAGKVLEIGTGSGYQAAILAELCDSVFTIEIFETLGKRAKKTLQKLGYSNVCVKIGDGYKGWEEHAPFDAIIVTCSPKAIPKPLEQQLKEGGRMIIPVGGSLNQTLVLLKKKNNRLYKQNVLPVRFVPMIDSMGIRY